MSDKQNPLMGHLSGLPMKALIGAPLKAAADANAEMAKTQVDFLLNTCFERPQPQQGQQGQVPSNHTQLRPIMIQFQVERMQLRPDGSMEKRPLVMNLSVPLMSIIPINSLAVETVKVSFNMEIKSSQENNTDKSFKSNTPNNKQRRNKNNKGQEQGNEAGSTELFGILANSEKSNSKSTSNLHYEVSLTAGQLPLPTGITTILDMFNKSMAPLPASNALSPSPKPPPRPRPDAQQYHHDDYPPPSHDDDYDNY